MVFTELSSIRSCGVDVENAKIMSEEELQRILTDCPDPVSEVSPVILKS